MKTEIKMKIARLMKEIKSLERQEAAGKHLDAELIEKWTQVYELEDALETL